MTVDPEFTDLVLILLYVLMSVDPEFTDLVLILLKRQNVCKFILQTFCLVSSSVQ